MSPPSQSQSPRSIKKPNDSKKAPMPNGQHRQNPPRIPFPPGTYNFSNFYTGKMFRQTVKQTTRAARAVRNNHGHAKAELPPWANEPAFPNPSPEAAKEFKAAFEASKHHAEQTSGLWRKISWFVAAPAVLATAVNTYFVEMEHAHHREHLSHVKDEEWPAQYDYMNIRSKPFFWGNGDETLFWNPVINRHVKD